MFYKYFYSKFFHESCINKSLQHTSVNSKAILILTYELITQFLVLLSWWGFFSSCTDVLPDKEDYRTIWNILSSMYTNNQGCIVWNDVPFFSLHDQFPLKILLLKIILTYKYRSILHCGQRTQKKKNKEKKHLSFQNYINDYVFTGM